MSAPDRVACALPIAELGGRRERWFRLALADGDGVAAVRAMFEGVR